MKLIIASHGKLGQELINSAEMIFGKLEEGVVSVSLMPDMSFESFKEEAERVLADAGDEEVLVLVDLFGGTPSNVFSTLSRTHACQVVTGANLPVLIEMYTRAVCGNGSETAREMAEAALETIKKSAVHTNALLEGGAPEL